MSTEHAAPVAESLSLVFTGHEPELVSVRIFELGVLHVLVPFGFAEFPRELDIYPFQFLIGPSPPAQSPMSHVATWTDEHPKWNS